MTHDFGILVGCPLMKRAWILPTWFNYVKVACDYAGLTPEFVFIVSQQEDFDAIAEFHNKNSWVKIHIGAINEPEHPDRRWNNQRMQHMVDVRNALLTLVRERHPVYFWSLDSDILVNPHVLEQMLLCLEDHPDWDAVGSKVYLSTTGTGCTSYAMVTPNGTLRRPDSIGIHKVDAIMASKLMTRRAYEVDYAFHRQGEDIGWALNCKKAGVNLGYMGGGPVSKHVMKPHLLNQPDKRLGW